MENYLGKGMKRIATEIQSDSIPGIIYRTIPDRGPGTNHGGTREPSRRLQLVAGFRGEENRW